jgi:acetyl-CoA carboxylase / biotin carboxylase 1
LILSSYRPTIFDPSELRTDVTGKIVRYLQDSGGNVAAGEPYVEVEAMKMIMPIKATESGKITHSLSPGSVISAGDLLGSLELADPSKIKKISTFEGVLDIPAVATETDAKSAIKYILSGFKGDPEAAAQAAFQEVDTFEAATALAQETLNEYLRVERLFYGKLKDDVVRDLTKANSDKLDVVIAENQAHQQLRSRNNLVLAMLRTVETFGDRYGVRDMDPELQKTLEELAGLRDKMYGDIPLVADTIIRQSKVPSFDERVEELRGQLNDASTDLIRLSRSPTLSAGVDLLTHLFSDSDKSVRSAALEVYVRRVYRAHRVLDLKVNEVNGRMSCQFSFQFADVEQSVAPIRQGLLEIVPSLDTLSTTFPEILNDLSATIGDRPTRTEGGPLNMLHIAVTNTNNIDPQSVEAVLQGEKTKLNRLGVRTVNVLLLNEKKDPSYYSFPECEGYKEDTLRRNMRPTFHHLLELNRLSKNFDLERIQAIGRNAQVYIGTEKSSLFVASLTVVAWSLMLGPSVLFSRDWTSWSVLRPTQRSACSHHPASSCTRCMRSRALTRPSLPTASRMLLAH